MLLLGHQIQKIVNNFLNGLTSFVVVFYLKLKNGFWCFKTNFMAIFKELLLKILVALVQTNFLVGFK